MVGHHYLKDTNLLTITFIFFSLALKRTQSVTKVPAENSSVHFGLRNDDIHFYSRHIGTKYGWIKPDPKFPRHSKESDDKSCARRWGK